METKVAGHLCPTLHSSHHHKQTGFPSQTHPHKGRASKAVHLFCLDSTLACPCLSYGYPSELTASLQMFAELPLSTALILSAPSFQNPFGFIKRVTTQSGWALSSLVLQSGKNYYFCHLSWRTETTEIKWLIQVHEASKPRTQPLPSWSLAPIAQRVSSSSLMLDQNLCRCLYTPGMQLVHRVEHYLDQTRRIRTLHRTLMGPQKKYKPHCSQFSPLENRGKNTREAL